MFTWLVHIPLSVFLSPYIVYFSSCAFLCICFPEEVMAWSFHHFADLLLFNIYSFWCRVLCVLTSAQYHALTIIVHKKLFCYDEKKKTCASPTQPSHILVNHLASTDYFTVSKVLPFPQLHIIGNMHYVWWGYGEIGTLVHCWFEFKIVPLLWKTNRWFLKKLNIELTYDPTILLSALPQIIENSFSSKHVLHKCS